jgi:hypothetical protein
MQLVWSNLQKLFSNASSIATPCILSDQILQKLFWHASITTHATCLIKFTEAILKCIVHYNSCNLSDNTLMPEEIHWVVVTAHGHKKQRKVRFWKKHYTTTCRMKAQSISFFMMKKPLLNFEVLWKCTLEANIKVYKVCNLELMISSNPPSTAPKPVILKLRSYVCAQEKEEKQNE